MTELIVMCIAHVAYRILQERQAQNMKCDMRNAICRGLTTLLFTLNFSLFTSQVAAQLENGMAAALVLGQPDFNSNTSNNGGITARSYSSQTFDVSTDGERYYISDFNNSRIMIYNSAPTINFAPADMLLGQPHFNTNTADNAGATARVFRSNISVSSDGQRLFVSNHNADRVLIFSSIPTTNFVPADIVLGQPNFTTEVVNNGGLSARSLQSPRAVTSDGKRLFVCDTGNNRILIWNTIPTSIFVPADLVLGQPDFVSNTANNGGISASTLNNPVGLAWAGKRLFVLDNTNRRLLIWNTLPTINGAPADLVLGQPDFSTNDVNHGGLSARSLNPGNGFVNSDGEKLSVGDAANNRVLIWTSIPTQNFAPADFVLGQPDFKSNTANNGGVSAKTLNNPRGTLFDGGRFWVADDNNARVLIFNIGESNIDDLGPQFSQGKAIVGKVFWDMNADGIQKN